MEEKDACLDAETKCMFLYLIEKRKGGDKRDKNEIFIEWINCNANRFRNIWNERSSDKK